MLNVLQKKLKNSSATKISQQMFRECKQIIQYCVDTFVLSFMLKFKSF